VKGEFDLDTGLIICKVPKQVINNPQKGDVLTNTYASAFQRFGFIGRLGFDRAILRSLIYIIVDKSLADFAPEPEKYGSDYIIQY